MKWIEAKWNAPLAVRALTTTREQGFSQGEFCSFNCCDYVGDDPQAVSQNRQLLHQTLMLPSEPIWLNQVHGTAVFTALDQEMMSPITADAAYTQQKGKVLAIMTADCLPVFFSNKNGTEIALAHAGWRGLLNGILENTLATFHADPKDILIWFGPAIGPNKFEVGSEVKDAFTTQNSAAKRAFLACRDNKYLADLYLLAKFRLEICGVKEISGGDFCTMTDDTHFFSYRRDKKTGRMVSLIWLV